MYQEYEIFSFHGVRMLRPCRKVFKYKENVLSSEMGGTDVASLLLYGRAPWDTVCVGYVGQGEVGRSKKNPAPIPLSASHDHFLVSS